MDRVNREDEIAEWLSGWFAQYGKTLSPEHIRESNQNYIDDGLVDSIQMIEFIMDIESHFRLRVTPGMMKDPRFTTLRGLVGLVDESIA